MVVVVQVVLSCSSLVYLRIYPRIYSKTVSFMGDLYWSSLANSLIDYYWFNLLKRNRFRRGVTVLWPKCYTLEVKLGTIDTVYNTNIAQLWEPGSCIPPLPILSCYAAFTGFQYIVCFNTSLAIQYSIAKTF